MNATMTVTFPGQSTYTYVPYNCVLTAYRQWDLPEDPDDGSAGVREPRRPLPTAPAMAMALG